MLEKLSTLLIFLALPFLSWGQEITIRGNIVSATDSEPVIGANVLIKGKNVGTVTDIDGNFSLEAGRTDVLVISYIGFETLEIPIDGQTVLNITMTEDMQLLDEVVAVGYITQRKADLTGAVSVVSVEDILSVAENNPMKALQGRVPGMTISADGNPSGAATVRIPFILLMVYPRKAVCTSLIQTILKVFRFFATLPLQVSTAHVPPTGLSLLLPKRDRPEESN